MDTPELMIFCKDHHLMKGINTMELDVCKASIMSIPNMCDNYSGTVKLYLTFIKQMKADNHQMNVLEVNYSKNRQGGGKISSGKRGSSGISISNSSNAAVDDRFYEKHEYLALSSDNKNTLRLKLSA
jgi:hypothetical protein